MKLPEIKSPWRLLKELHEALERNQEQARRTNQSLENNPLRRQMAESAERFENT